MVLLLIDCLSSAYRYSTFSRRASGSHTATLILDSLVKNGTTLSIFLGDLDGLGVLFVTKENLLLILLGICDGEEEGTPESSSGRSNLTLLFKDSLLNELDKEMSRRLLIGCVLSHCNEGYFLREENGVILLRLASCRAFETRMWLSKELAGLLMPPVGFWPLYCTITDCGRDDCADGGRLPEPILLEKELFDILRAEEADCGREETEDECDE